MDEKILELKEIIKESKNIVFSGGAGVSTESGIPDFRSDKGIYNSRTKGMYSPEEIISHSFFMKKKEEFYSFYKEKMIFVDALPNDAHRAIAKLEEEGKLKAVITQNIDGLHQKAGSKNVIELHGSVLRNYCMDCNEFYDVKYIVNSKTTPICEKCGGYIKPDVVLYEESLNSDDLDNAIKYISKADTLIIGGTSLVVYPAAGLINYFKGDNLVLINKSATSRDNIASLVINDSIGNVLSKTVFEN